MKMNTRFAAVLTVIFAILLFIGDIRAENFTLSDEGIMMLHLGNYYGGAKASIMDKKDVPGPGVEFEIFMPAGKAFEGHITMVCSKLDRGEGPNEPLVGIKVGKYNNFELKFTLVSINGKTTPDAGGELYVGAKIGCDGSRGGYRPKTLSFGEGQDTNTISTTSISGTPMGGETISEIGFESYIANISGWDPNGSTVKLLVEPVEGDTAIPEQPQREHSKAKGKYIYVDAKAGQTGDGTNWTESFNYLQDAIAAASKGDQIWVAEGIYRPYQGKNKTLFNATESFILKNGVEIYGGFPSGGGKWEDSNPVTHQTILSGDLRGNDTETKYAKELTNNSSRSDNSVHVVTASGTDDTTVLDGFIITGGNTKHIEKGRVTSDLMQGAGLYCRSGSPTISNCVFKFNSAEMGAVYFWRGNPKLTNCKFIDNYATDSGAGIYLSESNPIIINCVFSGNTALEKGGAIYNEFNKAEFINCTITRNYAYAGGGVYNQKSTPVLTNCILWANTSRYGADEPGQVYGINVKAANCYIQGLTEQLGGKNCFSKDPQISDLETSGYHLSAGSPCIDAGDSKEMPNRIDTDIDMNQRISGSAIDIGAVEAQ